MLALQLHLRSPLHHMMPYGEMAHEAAHLSGSSDKIRSIEHVIREYLVGDFHCKEAKSGLRLLSMLIFRSEERR